MRAILAGRGSVRSEICAYGATMTDRIDIAAKLGANTNLVHGFIYFAPEATERYNEIGLTPEQQYFASRAAPMGPVPAEVVVATFFNFHPPMTHAAIPGAWANATPEAIQTARMAAAGAVLRRCCPDVSDEDIAAITELAGRVIAGLGFEGKPLAAANLAVEEPTDPWERMWQRITVLREWRGDVHVAALTAANVDAVEALILHAATEQVPRAALITTRQWPEADWAAGVERLRARGLVDADEQFTDAGRAFRDDIELRTNEACGRWVDLLGDDADRFRSLLRPIRVGLMEGGAFAAMGRS
ncbi:MAG: hypothetical protein ACI9C1_003126 [Candidatus Aldehydirespiratoraceae bacterium]|jgi:hypothetical protein